MVKLKNLKANQSGIRSCLKSGGVKSEINNQIHAIASKANSMVSDDSMDVPAFVPHLSDTGVTAIGYVSTASKHGKYAEAKYHILDSCI